MPFRQEAKFLERLAGLKATYSVEAVTRPRGKEAFDYGQACGIYEGLVLAEQLFEKVLEEEDSDEP